MTVNKTRLLRNILKDTEEPDFTFIDKDFPPIIKKTKGFKFYDIEGKEYIDFCSFFGVSFTGHSQNFIKKEAKKGTFHGLGDIIPSESKIKLMQTLSEITGENFKGILLQNGSDAIEACLRSSYLYKKSNKIIAFHGSYHGTSLPALSVTYSPRFRKRFNDLLPFKTEFFDFSLNSIEKIKKFIKNNRVSAIIIEPIQVRAGVRIPEKAFLEELKAISVKYDIPLIFDEIFTGFGKTGKMFAKDYFDIQPDLIAFGKALSSAFPISGCFGKPEIMDLWGQNKGEAIYTYTFSGNPFFTRVALKNLNFLDKHKYKEKVKNIEKILKNKLIPIQKEYPNKIKEIRGVGALWGVEFRPPLNSVLVFRKLLEEYGFLTLPSGLASETIEIIPPLVIKNNYLLKLISALKKTIETL